MVALTKPHRSTTVKNSKPPSKPPPPVIPAQAGIQKPRPPSQHPPKPAPRVRSPTRRCTGYRPAPVRRSRTNVLYPAAVLPRPLITNTATASPIQPSFRRRPESRTHAGYPNMRPRLAASARCPANRRTGYRPAPVRRSRTRALFPTPIAPTSAENSKRPRKPETPVIPAQAGIQCGRSVSTGAPATAHAQDLALPRISRAPTSRARRTAYPHPSTTPAGHKETGVSLQ